MLLLDLYARFFFTRKNKQEVGTSSASVENKLYHPKQHDRSAYPLYTAITEQLAVSS